MSAHRSYCPLQFFSAADIAPDQLAAIRNVINLYTVHQPTSCAAAEDRGLLARCASTATQYPSIVPKPRTSLTQHCQTNSSIENSIEAGILHGPLP
jgi:hypothetical protein